jgi:DNA-binding NtrC family response regulator
MSEQIHILVIEDEPEVLDALVRDLENFEELFPVEMVATAEEARTVIDDILDTGGRIGLILCDHILPGENGVELLVDLQEKPETKSTRKVLVTGQAGLADTVKAVNEADLNHFIEKPWTEEHLHKVVVNQLTSYVIENEKTFLPYMHLLDSTRLSEEMRKRGNISDY